MSRSSLKFTKILGTALCFGTLAIAGCGGSSSPAASADATCGDFGKMSEADQKSTAQMVLDANDVKTDGLGAGAKIDAARIAITAYCKASGDTATVNNVTDLGDAANSIKQAIENSSGSGQ